MNIERNDERILIKYVDVNFNTFKCVITTDDVFVVNFCRRDLGKMEEILKKNTIIEMDDYYLFKVEEPIFLEYQLKKEKQEEITNLGLILEKFKILEEKLEKFNQILDENRKMIVRLENENAKLQMKIGNIDYRLGDGILLPGYNGGIIPKETKHLQLVCKLECVNDLLVYRSKDYFNGTSLEPISQLKELETIHITFDKFINFDFLPLANCKKLKRIDFSPKNLDFHIHPNLGHTVKIKEISNGCYELIKKID